MSEREAYRERLRARLRKRDAEVVKAQEEVAAEAAALIERAAARQKPAGKSYDNILDWQGKASQGGKATHAARVRRTEKGTGLSAAEGTRAYHQRLHEELVARGEKACPACGEVKALAAFERKALPSGRMGWQGYCRECSRLKARRRYEENREGAA